MQFEMPQVLSCESKSSEKNKEELNELHLYVPWDHKKINDLMFQYKNILNEHGSCYIPYMSVGKSKDQIKLDPDSVEALKQQLESGVETHLYMSNLDSIHVWKVVGIKTLDEDMQKERIVKKLQSAPAIWWIEVDDLFVYRANHLGEASEVMDELEKLTSPIKRPHIFSSIKPHKISLDDINIEQPSKKWIEVNRNLTYDYFIRHCDLQDNIYQESWEVLGQVTRHCLVNSEQARQQAVLYKSHEKLNFLRESYESYLSAVLNELNNIYVLPFAGLLQKYPCLQEAWGEVREQSMNPRLKELLNGLMQTEDPYINSLADFLVYIREVKSTLFSLKTKFERKIGKEEYLYIESFLGGHAHLVDAFLCKHLDSKVEDLIDLKDWFLDLLQHADSIPIQLMKDCSLKMTHLLSLISSTNYEDNIIFKLIEEKIGKTVARKHFSEEIQNLRASLKKIA
jgi:hypothetical protein